MSPEVSFRSKSAQGGDKAISTPGDEAIGEEGCSTIMDETTVMPQEMHNDRSRKDGYYTSERLVRTKRDTKSFKDT